MLSKLWQKFFVLTLLCGVFFVCSIASAGTLRVVYPANGLYSLQPKCAPNRELTVQDASVANGANVILWSINSNWHTQPSHQKWRITRLGNSQWYKIEAENSGKALNVHNGISQNGTNVTIWPYGGRMHQYRFLDAGGGYYAIQPNINGNFVLDVNSGANADGANVHVWQWNGSPAQLWKMVARTPKSPVNPIVKPVSRPASTVAGDANGDGEFNRADVDLVTDYTLGTISSLPCQKNADVNGDGKISLSDVALMNMRLNGLNQKFPIEENATPTPAPQPSYREWQGTAAKRTTAYMDSALTRRNGTEYVDAGDRVTVLKEEGNAYFVRYPVRNGTKERWVAKDIFTKSEPTPIKFNSNGLIVHSSYNVNVSPKSKENQPHYENKSGNRNGNSYNTVIDQFNVTSNNRYRRTANATYCNIFAWDVMSAMNVVLPHWIKKNVPSNSITKGANEINVNSTCVWMNNYARQYGWRTVNASEAQSRANSGYPTIAIWKNPSGNSGHIAVVRPEGNGYSYSSSKGPVIAQAGANNYNRANVSGGFGSSKMSAIVYWTHD